MDNNIPQLVIDYNNAGHQSSAGRAINILMSELTRLQQWKKEQILVWGPVLDYMQNHHDLSLGDNIAKRVLEFLKERDAMK